MIMGAPLKSGRPAGAAGSEHAPRGAVGAQARALDELLGPDGLHEFFVQRGNAKARQVIVAGLGGMGWRGARQDGLDALAPVPEAFGRWIRHVFLPLTNVS